MVGKMAITMSSIKIAIMVAFITTTVVFSDDVTPIPADKSQLATWFNNNVKPYNERKNMLDHALVTAESSVTVVKVMKNGGGDFKTISDAIKSIPNGNTKRVVIYIGSGTYVEKIKIERTKPFVTLYGAPGRMPNLTYGGTAHQYGTVDSATLIVESDYFVAANIVISNSAPMPDGKRPGAQAAALRLSGDKAALYGITLNGFQDTVCDDKGRHFFKDCTIQGTVDFIFGSGKSLYLNTKLNVVGETGIRVIAAQARNSETEDTGYSFVQCEISGSGTGTFLGRAWMARPKVVYAYTTMTKVINPAGWSENFKTERANTVYFGEYKNSGEGATPQGRVKFTKQLSDVEAKPFISLGYIEASKWLLPPPTPKV